MESTKHVAHCHTFRSMLRDCNKVKGALLAKMIYPEEFADTVNSIFVRGCQDCLPGLLEKSDPDCIEMLFDYYNDNIVPLDFMPSPASFLLGGAPESTLERAKVRMRPTYVAIYGHILNEQRRRMELSPPAS